MWLEKICNIVQANNLYLDIIEENTKPHCKNLAYSILLYVGSTECLPTVFN